MRSTTVQERHAALVLALLLAALTATAIGGTLAKPFAAAASHPEDLLRSMLPVLGVVLLSGGVVRAARAVVLRRSLASRVRLEVLPSEQFDPSPEAVLRFASQLAHARPGAVRVLARRAYAVRVLLVSGSDGLVHYQLEAHRRSLALLRAALGAYSQLSISETPAAPLPAVGRVRAELVLARPSVLPLADIGLQPDPLQSLAAALGDLDSEHGGQVQVALDVMPVTPAQRRRLRRRLLAQAQREHHRTGPSVSAAVLGTLDAPRRPGRADASELAGRRWQSRALEQKLGGAGALFAMQLLLAVSGPRRSRAKTVMQGLLGCFDAWAGENHLRVAGLGLGGLRFAGSDVPWRRRGFDRRLTSGLFAPRRKSIVSASEIAGLLKPPTVHCESENVARSGGAIPPPPVGLPTFTGQPHLVPLGRVDDGRLVGVRVGETFFSYMAGRSRYGKTETAIGQFVHLVRAGHGGLFLDPHADAITEIKTYLTDPGIRERVIEIDLSTLQRDTPQPGWNLFALQDRTPGEAAGRVEAFVDALAAALRWDERNTRALNLATQAAQALIELAPTLPPELAPTIFQVPTLLSDQAWREQALPFIARGTAQFFTDRFPRLPAEAVTAVTNIIDRLRAARPVAALLGSPVSTYEAARAMRDGLIVLACPGSGSTRDRVMANLLVYDVLHAAKARAAIPPQARRPFWVFLDELQTYDGPNLPVLLEQSAKYGGRAFLFNQNPERLTDATWNAVTTNRSHLLSTTVNARAAQMITREWAGQITPDVLTRLARFTYLACITHGHRTTKPFLIHGLPARELHGAHHHPDHLPALERAIDTTTRRQPVVGTLQALDTHDQRIADWLAQHAETKRRPVDEPQSAGGARVLRTGARTKETA